MQVITLNAADVIQTVSKLWWPVLRISGFVATAPLISGSMVPPRVKILITLALLVLIAPLAPMPASLSFFSAAGLLAALEELLIGVAIGMVVQLTFEALTLAGQTVSMTMGLGFATLIDPQHGANTTVVGQLFSIFAMLVYLAVNGHLVLIGALVDSFQSLPIGAVHIDREFPLSVASWGGSVFEAGLLIALPAVVALVIVNMALGVVSRAAPQLNLFGIGFTITLICGFFVLMVGLDGMMVGINGLIERALQAVVDLVGSPAGVH